ncbi:DNA cytosine methyltransferase [Paenibacillus sp. MAH-36]|uniref:Cytosine-specific methyltransferase n=1 Tax=Paenibacillus violae TaxID=3077234 RepID=A0ABU3RNH6_9BACL|nr:DNA cytosine methyltransferase [Paenibacillus sp. PFR10]MDU0205813.1 DNA cytosine methyltransferase [Paenibacillus sp. PFR10]
MIKLDQRGRGKFKPAPDLAPEEIKKFLLEKIMQEKEVEAVIDLEGELHPQQDKFNVVSLFCGAGGLDLGFELAGLQATVGEKQGLDAFEHSKEEYNKIRSKSVFHTIFANDFFKEAIETYRLNVKDSTTVNVLPGDIRKVKQFPKADLVLGGFPCPGFSGAGPRLIDDERNFLYLQFIRCLTQSDPKIFVAENVKGMMTLGKGEVFKQIVEDFESVGYKVHYLKAPLNARDYGVPQLRERVFLVGVRNDIDFTYEFPFPTHGPGTEQPYETLESKIGDLRSEPGPYYEGSFSSIYMSRNRKKDWNEQSFTIQASGRQAPLHPGCPPMRFVEKDKFEFTAPIGEYRRLSVKEIKRIQTFPDWYEFYPQEAQLKNGQLDKIYKQIGNAVPVMLARAIALPIARYAKKYLEDKAESTASVPVVNSI